MAGSRTKGMRKRNPKAQRIARVPRKRLQKISLDSSSFSRFLLQFLEFLVLQKFQVKSRKKLLGFYFSFRVIKAKHKKSFPIFQIFSFNSNPFANVDQKLALDFCGKS